jgi:hypothetical protein
MSRKPVRVVVQDEADGRFVILTYPNGDVVRQLVDPKKKPIRKPRRPRIKLGLERLDKTRRKQV